MSESIEDAEPKAPVITNKTLDRLHAEMSALAAEMRSAAKRELLPNGRRACADVAYAIEEIASSRLCLARFAELLRQHSTRHSAIAELTGSQAA